jgi:hypothetical protein
MRVGSYYPNEKFNYVLRLKCVRALLTILKYVHDQIFILVKHP